MFAPADPGSTTDAQGFYLWSRLTTSSVAQWAGMTALMFALSLGGMSLEHWSGHLVVGWPMNAVALACLVQSRSSRWLGFLVLFTLANLAAPMAHGKTLPVAAVLSLVNALQVMGCAAVLRRMLGSKIDLGRYRDLWVFTLVAGVLWPLLSIGLVSLAQPQQRTLIQSLPRMVQWAMGASVGNLVVTPIVFACTPARLRAMANRLFARRIVLVLMAYTIVVLLISIQGYGGLRVLLVPALLWLTFQLGTAGATLGLLIQAVVVTAFVVAGADRVAAGESAADQLMGLQLGLVLNALCAYPVAAALAHRRRLAESLAHSNTSLEQAQRLTGIAEQISGIGYSRYDVATGENIHSANLVRILGPRQDFSISTHPEDYARTLTETARAIATGEDYDSWTRVRSADGGWRSLRGRNTCEKGPDGKVTALVSVVFDVTDMELADEALRASEARYRLLAEHSNDLIMLTDQDDRLSYVSPAVFALTGHRPEDLLGKIAGGLMHPEDAPRANAHFAAMNRNPDDPETGDFIYRARHRDGRWLWLEARSAVLRDAETGEVTGQLHVARDVTERKAMEEELQRKCAEAEAANLAKSEFLANMSHEIRTPLNGVMGVASALARTELSPTQSEMVSLVETSAKTLETLLSDILDLARIEAGKMELRPEPFDLAVSVNACGALFDAAAQAKGLDLEVAIAPDALGAYLGDAARIRQILCNLLGNAVKFTQKGRVKLTVEARHGKTASELRFQVSDTGIGFDEETKARLFSRFEQADGSITRRFGGSGLGLSICRSLAEAMGGRLDADAKQGKGSVFTVTLELTRCASAADHGFDDTEAAPVHDPLVGMRVLLAEDHPTNRRVVELILSAVGVNLTCVEDGQQAVDAFRTDSFDLVLMDMQMPVMDGLTAIAEIRKIEAATAVCPTPIHMLTANAMPEHIAASLAAGADGHLSKPILAEALLELVAEARGASHSLRPDLHLTA